MPQVKNTNIPAVPMPKDGKWPKSGILYDDVGRWSIAWRVHDAQFWGVAQRRRRIALVVDFGGITAPEILFEPQGVSRHTEACNKQGKGTASPSPSSPKESVYTYDARGNGDGRITSTLTGDHDSRISDYTNVIVQEPCLGINGDRHESGLSILEEKTHTLETTTRESVFVKAVHENQSADIKLSSVAYTLTIGGGKPGQSYPCICIGKEGDPSYTLNTVEQHGVCTSTPYIVRRLTPLECTRLQGFPDHWVDIGDWIDSNGKKHKEADAPKYKALGNSIALPFWKWMCRNIVSLIREQKKDCSYTPTMASLFAGIGGFDLCWNLATQNKDSVLWLSEIEDFPIAVLKTRFS